MAPRKERKVSRAEPKVFLDARKALASNLMGLRARLQLSQRALSDLSGVNIAYVTQIETANRNPSLLILGRLATALNCDVATLLTKPKRDGKALRYSTRGSKPG